MIGQLNGTFTKWTLFDYQRLYGTVQNLPFYEAREYIKSVCFNGQTGAGQQRAIVESHVRRLKKEMETGAFTPTNISAACSKKHRQALELNEDGTFVLPVNSEDPLLHTDGGHRFEAMRCIVKELEEKLAKAGEKDKEKLARWLEQAKAVSVTVTVYFDGEPAQDFVRLQQGRAVDAAHILSMKVQQKLLKDQAIQTGFDVARLLHKQEGSPVRDQVRFDSRGKLPLPISTLCSSGASDIGTSLVGLARIGQMGDKAKDPAWLAGAVTAVLKTLRKEAPTLLACGKVLTPMSDDGTRGSTTMLIGLGVVLAYRMSVLAHGVPTEDDLNRLVQAAKSYLDDSVNGNFSGPTKRTLLGLFAKDFLADLEGDRHDGLPISLLRTLSASAFGVGPLPKEKKQKKEQEPVVAETAANQTQVVKLVPDLAIPIAVASEPASGLSVAAVA